MKEIKHSNGKRLKRSDGWDTMDSFKRIHHGWLITRMELPG